MNMNGFTVEETNLLSIYHEGGKQETTRKIRAAMPYMDEEMRALADRTLEKLDKLTEEEYAELAPSAAGEEWAN